MLLRLRRALLAAVRRGRQDTRQAPGALHAMLRDYEAEAAMAQAKGEPMPDPNLFFANWNIAHPEEPDDIPTAAAANQYGSVS